MTVHSIKDRNHMTPSITGIDATVTGCTAKTESVGHKLYMDNSSLELFGY